MNKNAVTTANSHGNENSSKRARVSHVNGKHSVNLQKRGSTRFQFGLIIAMTLVYIALELSFENLEYKPIEDTYPLEELTDYHPKPFTIEKETPIKEKLVALKTKDPVFKIVPDDTPEVTLEEFVDKPEIPSPDLGLNEIDYKPTEPDVEEVIFIAVEDKPIFPGCENVGKEERLSCFTSKMQEHIKKNFRYPVPAQEMGIKGKVFVSFKIGKEGFVTDLKLRGPHKILEEEAFRIINKLPKMTPGKQRGVAVKVPFSIPINFQLQD